MSIVYLCISFGANEFGSRPPIPAGAFPAAVGSGPTGLCLGVRKGTTATCICTARPHSRQEDTGLHGHGPWAGAAQAWPVGQAAQTGSHWAHGPGGGTKPGGFNSKAGYLDRPVT